MATVWIENLSGQRCPTCDATLIALAGRFEPMGRPQPVYTEELKSLRCPAGHELPRDESGQAAGVGGRERAPEDPVREVASPR